MEYDKALIEEYKALRAEILSRSSRQFTRLVVSSAGAFALVGAGVSATLPEAVLAAIIVMLVGWRDHIHQGMAIARIGAYIEVMIEPETKGIRWEKTLNSLHASPFGNRSLVSKIKDGLLTSYSVLTLVLIAIWIVEMLTSNFEILRLYLNISIMIGEILLFIMTLSYAVKNMSSREKWTNKFSEHKTSL